jgi:hypothetical protein
MFDSVASFRSAIVVLERERRYRVFAVQQLLGAKVSAGRSPISHRQEIASQASCVHRRGSRPPFRAIAPEGAG